MSSRQGERLDPQEAAVFYGTLCPDCGGAVREGPSGGGSINFHCLQCASGFNDTGFGVERITPRSPMGEYLPEVRPRPTPPPAPTRTTESSSRARWRRDTEDFYEVIRKMPDEELELAWKHGRVAMSNWKADMIYKEFERRRKQNDPVKRPTTPTAWAHLLKDPIGD
jgi:hypothetical protein